MKSKLPLLAGILIFALSGCKQGSQDNQNGNVKDDPKYTTSDASEIFFRNVRSIYYDKTSMEEARLDVYRIKERVEAEDEPVLNLSIVVNWRSDEAYVLTEPNAFLRQMDTIRVMWKDTSRNESGIYAFGQGNKDAHFRFATQLYRSIDAEHQLQLLMEDQKVSFLDKRNTREPFRKTMVDYFRLVDLL
ncbi:MAG: hypothetical protein ACLFUB_16160 [Cyclobacteriaceae bacterium]